MLCQTVCVFTHTDCNTPSCATLEKPPREGGSDVCLLWSFMWPKSGPLTSSFYAPRHDLLTWSQVKTNHLSHPLSPCGAVCFWHVSPAPPVRWSRRPPQRCAAGLLPFIRSLRCPAQVGSLSHLRPSLSISYLPKHIHSYGRLWINEFFARNHSPVSSLLSMISCSIFSYTVHFDI